ncbi:DNA-3-methyladenine glycosylase family protein [Henriciella aquimarina]|uniref:DNA-3-methyladenine glycosylase family protein n=1 Tax=Henriciella aquimarina TaxID=545261 RepID=UPI000A0655CE|nr:DNA-3-methyladenine glycosylase [Henriciella aquimarina]
MSGPDPDTLHEACTWLSARDTALARAFEGIGVPQWRVGAPDYAVIARMIAFQQITTKAAASIWGRVETALGEVCTDAVLGADEETLRACGLSRPKIRHLRSIADAIHTGALDLARVHGADMEAARKELVAVKGIGPWTADLFLLSCGRLDAFPQGDVGLMESYRLLSEAEARHEAKAFTALADAWRPYRGVAAHLLWGWINAEREKAYAADGGGRA